MTFATFATAAVRTSSLWVMAVSYTHLDVYKRQVLGPFQGKPACIEIPIGKGVCGTAVSEDAVMLIKNVHEFPGHIACDNASNSEIVIPLHNGAGKIVGVLDIDSPQMCIRDSP